MNFKYCLFLVNSMITIVYGNIIGGETPSSDPTHQAQLRYNYSEAWVRDDGSIDDSFFTKEKVAIHLFHSNDLGSLTKRQNKEIEEVLQDRRTRYDEWAEKEARKRKKADERAAAKQVDLQNALNALVKEREKEVAASVERGNRLLDEERKRTLDENYREVKNFCDIQNKSMQAMADEADRTRAEAFARERRNMETIQKTHEMDIQRERERVEQNERFLVEKLKESYARHSVSLQETQGEDEIEESFGMIVGQNEDINLLNLDCHATKYQAILHATEKRPSTSETRKIGRGAFALYSTFQRAALYSQTRECTIESLNYHINNIIEACKHLNTDELEKISTKYNKDLSEVSLNSSTKLVMCFATAVAFLEMHVKVSEIQRICNTVCNKITGTNLRYLQPLFVLDKIQQLSHMRKTIDQQQLVRDLL